MSKSKESIHSVVKNYMFKTNRPYSANDVFNNLNTLDQKQSKTVISKALEDLSANQDIKEKVNGKQKIYFIDQNLLKTVDEEEKNQLDEQWIQTNKEVEELKDEIRRKESRLSSSKQSLTLDQITQQTNDLEKEIIGLEKRLEAIESKAKDFDPKVNESVRNERQKLVTEWKKRKRMATQMIDTILESYPKSKKALIEEIGVETDEDMSVSLPQI